MKTLTKRALLAFAAPAAFLAASATTALAIAPGPLAGYTASPTGAPTQTVSVTVKVPKVNCKSVPENTGFQGVDDGVRIVEPSGATQTNSGAGVNLLCFGPTVTYQPHLQVDGTSVASSLTIKPGDLVTATAEMSASEVTVTLKDGTESQTATGASASVLRLDAGAVAGNCNEATECAPVPKTAGTSFTNALIDGVSPFAAGAGKQELTDAKGEVEDSSTALKSKAKTSFKVKWVKSCGVEGIC
jgi:hypothetical protein